MSRGAILFCYLTLALCDDTNSGTRLAGIGYGSFLIILSIVLGILICIFAQTTTRPEIYSLLAVILPVFFILFFIFVPKKSSGTTTTSTTTDSSFVPHIIFTILILLMFVIALLLYTMDKLMVYKRAKNIARTGVVYVNREREEEARIFRRESAEGERSDQALME